MIALDILHIGRIAGSPVRFVRAPADKLDLPWHAVDDLFAALRMPARVAKGFRRDLLEGKFAPDVVTVRIDGEPAELVAPHYMAQGLIGAAIELGKTPASALWEYAAAVGEAFDVECANLGLSDDQRGHRLAQCATGNPHATMPRAMFDPASGEKVYLLDDVAKALNLSDEVITEAKANPDITSVMADPSKLRTIQ